MSDKTNYDPVAERDAIIAELRTENAKLTAERDMWKSNHDNQVELKRIICDRPDMGERAKLVAGLIAERDALARAVADAEEALDSMLYYEWHHRHEAKGRPALERFLDRNQVTPQARE